jgi:hypothetical protein
VNGTQQSVRGECSPRRMQSSVLHQQHLAVAVVRGFLSHILSLLSYNPSCRCRLSGHDLFSKQPVARDSYSCFTTHVAPQPEQQSVDLLPRGSDELVVAQARRWTVDMFSRACDALCKYLLVDIRGLVLGYANSTIDALGQSLSGELIIVLILTTILPFPNSLTYSRMARNIYPALYAPGIPTVALLGGGRTCCRKS